MTFKKKRAFYIGGTSWLLLCAVGNSATGAGRGHAAVLDTIA